VPPKPSSGTDLPTQNALEMLRHGNMVLEGRLVDASNTTLRAFLTLAERTAAQVSMSAHRAAEANRGKIPLIPVR